ncbi:tetratricopeptide repeat protein [Streptomyces botrytidirepellens]|uniref:tetratricopeptide repeat protein n=1 Tax=Streptomyces botrytidirepellens TaxID=2486417 RepID=UPI0016098374|nr:tetratricopeptide repeat protein [Streptomyces botrytidirepellens]
MSVSESGDALATGGGEALSGYRGPDPRSSSNAEAAVTVERSGNASASAAHAVAISGHVNQLIVPPLAPQAPVVWPLRLGSVPALASSFQDRTAVRARIDEARTGHATVVLTQVLSGGGGVGKTQLAAAYAHQSLTEGIELVVWVDASETEQAVAVYAHAARCVQAPNLALSKSPEDEARAFLQWLATTPHSWLIVLDDITDPDGMQPWWPPPSAYGRGQVLATTRRHDALLSGGGRAVVDIDTYSAEEADTYLRERLNSAHATHLLDEQAEALTKTLGYLPLALSHAAAYIINEDVPCTDYLNRFNHSAASLDDLFPRQADTEGYGRQVAAALLLSLNVAQACEPVGLATPALRLAAVLDPAGHPHSLWATDAVSRYLSAHRPASAPAGASTEAGPTQARAALRLLHRYGLLTDTAQAGPRAVRLHALTARAVREHTPSDTQPDVVKAATDALTELLEDAPTNNGEDRTVLRTNIDSLDAYAGDLLWEVEGHHLLRWAGRGWSLASAAVPYWQRLTATSERLLGRSHPKTLIARRDLAWTYFRADRFKEAFALLREDLPHQEQRLARHLAARRLRQKPIDTVALLEDTLAVRERLLGPEDPATLTCRVNLALEYWQRGKTSDAALLLERVLIDREATLGTHHPRTLSVANRLESWRSEHKKYWWSSKRLLARAHRADSNG